ncbi:unnamed protein product [Oreochromis niloticus]|nr:unnamed protein product [Mustela putorius furo]
MDPADSAHLEREVDLARILGLMTRISHASDLQTFSVGLNAIQAIFDRNPQLRQLSIASEFSRSLTQAKEAVKARELAQFTLISSSTPPQSQRASPLTPPQRTERSTAPLQQLQSQRRTPSSLTSGSDHPSPASCLAGMWSEDEGPVTVAPTPSVFSVSPVSKRKRRSRRRHPSPRPESSSCFEQLDVLLCSALCIQFPGRLWLRSSLHPYLLLGWGWRASGRCLCLFWFPGWGQLRPR